MLVIVTIILLISRGLSVSGNDAINSLRIYWVLKWKGEKMKTVVLVLALIAGISMAADRVVMFGEFTSTG